MIRRVLIISILTTSIGIDNNSNSLLRLALAAFVVSRAPESSISAFPALGFDGTNSSLLLGLLRPPLVVAEDFAFSVSATPPASILVVRVLVLFDNAAQSRASRCSRGANLLGGRVEELLG